jgi:hypothetical protein
MSHSCALARLESDLRMANRAKGTIQQYLASIRRFQEMTGKTAEHTSQEEIRRRVEHLQGQPIGRNGYAATIRPWPTWAATCTGSASPTRGCSMSPAAR